MGRGDKRPRRRPLSARKQSKLANRLRDETCTASGLARAAVQHLTLALAPVARTCGGTEGDVIVLLHHLVEQRQQHGADVETALRRTARSIDSGELAGLHGLPFKMFVHSADPIIEVCHRLCEFVWPDDYASYARELEAEQLKERYAYLSLTALLIKEGEELMAVKARMDDLGVEPDLALKERMRERLLMEGHRLPGHSDGTNGC